MRIKSLRADNFGKLQNYTLDLSEGFNIVYGNNEDGKSTLMALFRMLFYGGAAGADLVRNPRGRYRPWNDAAMRGSVTFEHGGVEYVLSRQFGNSNTTDRVELLNTTLSEKRKVSPTIGQDFFSMNEATFEKSVFIGQAGSLGKTGGSNDELTQKLHSLVSAADETVSPELVEERLKRAMSRLRAPDGRSRPGALDNLGAQLSRLKQGMADAAREEAEKKALQAEIAGLVQEEVACAQEIDALDKARRLQKKLETLHALEACLQGGRELEQQELETWRDGVPFDEAFVEQVQELLRGAVSWRERIGGREQAVQERLREQEELTAQALPAIDAEAVEALQGMERSRRVAAADAVALSTQAEYAACAQKLADQEVACAALEEEAQTADRSLHAAEDALHAQQAAHRAAGERVEEQRRLQAQADTAYQLALQAQASAQTQGQRDIAAAQALLEQAAVSRPAEEKQKSGAKMALIAIACVLAVASVLLGALVNPACYAGLAVALALLIVGLSRRQGPRLTADEQAASRARQGLIDAQAAAAHASADAAQAMREAESTLAALQARLDTCRARLTQEESLLASLERAREEARQTKAELDKRLGVENDRRERLREELSRRGSESTSTQEDAERLRTMAQDRTQEARELEARVREALAAAGCATQEELAARHTTYVAWRTRADAAQADLTRAQGELDAARAGLRQAEEAFLVHIGRFRPVQDMPSAAQALRSLRDALSAVSALRARLDGQRALLDPELAALAPQEMRARAEALHRELATNDGTIPGPLRAQDLDALQGRLAQAQKRFTELRERRTELNSGMRSRFAGRATVSDIEEQTRALDAEIADKATYHESLRLARDVLNDAAQEMRQVLSPRLNALTADIFSRLTGGKYEKVYVSSAFSILAQEAADSRQHEWAYLSSGTVDQAYLALRLAIAGELTAGGAPLPLLLDDPLLQYDDGRMEQALRFLAGEAQKTQIVFFTCRRSIVDWGERTPGVHVQML